MFTRTQPTNDVDTDFVSTSCPALSKSSDPIRGPVPKIKSPSRSSIEVPVIETDDVQPSALSVPSNRPSDAVPVLPERESSQIPTRGRREGEHDDT
ncbi:hypothetical protein BLNAU_21711 [Blattamonas nauphoetae]|uniref:Uncharacterized protein n=1 Tax=Blattamonas nauphoetae TaxID=2049346 RepID=A0ABQ9WV70_9EUKA|nr:hypothetical protein BLNAU_21711 [Blattamonas nauphoetae]